jgi:hypothetical protein
MVLVPEHVGNTSSSHRSSLYLGGNQLHFHPWFNAPLGLITVLAINVSMDNPPFDDFLS